jgi:N-acetylglucosamine-6-phosphate deacetylase
MNNEWSVVDAWHTGQQPEAITEAIKVGEQITDLLNEAATLVARACGQVDSIVDNASLRCQMILDQIAREAARLRPVLARLRAASKAVS